MTFYAVHDDDGRITQANKVFDPSNYDALLSEHGFQFVKEDCEGIRPPDLWYVWKSLTGAEKMLRERPVMQISVDKTTIKAGGSDAAIFTGCPTKAAFAITTNGLHLHSGVLDADELEVLIPVPCVYRVSFELWPYQTFAMDIEAVS